MAKLTHLAAASEQPHALPRRTFGPWLTTLALFVIALIPRTVAVGRFLTVDEGYHWLDRTDAFVKALRAGRYLDTFQTGHPGVTVMWLGAAGVWLHERLAWRGWVAARDEHIHLQLLRLPVAVAGALGIALAYVLLRRLFGGRVALLAALLSATEPFLVAHAQLLHLDSTLSTLVTLTLLLTLVAFGFDAPAAEAPPLRWAALLGAALTAGLALLTKSPALILAPMVALIALVSYVRCTLHAVPLKSIRSTFRFSVLGSRFFLPLALWLIVALAVWFALWPALWVDFVGTVGKVVRQADVEGSSPHAWGNFFWGQTVVDPGAFFYLVAVPFRLTPWTLLGLLASVGCTIYDLRFTIYDLRLRADESANTRFAPTPHTDTRANTRFAPTPPADTRANTRFAPTPRAASLLLAVFVLIFTLIMTLSPKKFDRYVLPIFPTLTIFAAIGWLRLYDARSTIYGWLRCPLGASRQATMMQRPLASCHLVILSIAVVNLWWFHPYELAYFNQALGGGPVAERTLPIGWGEVYEQAGAYIMAQPDGRDYPIAVRYGPLLEPYVDVPAVPLNWAAEPGKAGYAVLYIDEVQRNNIPPEVLRALATMSPIQTVRVHGIAYAHIYQLAQPVAAPRPADFGAALHLRGYDLDAAAVRSSGALTLTLHWQPSAPLPADYTLFVHVLDAGGAKIGGADITPGRAGRPTSTWQPGHYLSVTQTIPVRADAPLGRYWVAVGLYDPQTSARLPLRAPALPGAPADGGDALLLGAFTLR